MARKGMGKKEIQETLALLGMEMDAWQTTAIHDLLRDGELFLSGPRQIGKTTFAAGASILLALRGKKVLYLTHKADNARDVLSRVLAYARPLEPHGIVTRIAPSHGFTMIEFASGGSILFRVRTPGVSVGLTMDTVIWDEAQKVDAALVEEVAPVLSQAPEPIQLFIGTPSTEDDLRRYPDSPFLRAKREKSPRFTEFSGAANYDPTMEVTYAVAKRANPAWKRTPNFWASRKSALETMGHEAFCRQYLGIWKLPERGVTHAPELSDAEVTSILTGTGSKVSVFTAAVGITLDSAKAFIAFNDGAVVEVVHEVDLASGGTEALADWLVRRVAKLRQIVVPGNSRGKAFAELLREKRVGGKVKVTTLPEHSMRIERFLARGRAGQLRVFSSQETALALASFWLGYEVRSASHELRAGIPEDAALMMALVNSTPEAGVAGQTARPARAYIGW